VGLAVRSIPRHHVESEELRRVLDSLERTLLPIVRKLDGAEQTALVLSDANPQPPGTATPGTSSEVSRADHVHPSGGGGSSHDPVTIGTPNGLSLSGQQLSLAAATTGAPGAMSAADKTKLDGVATGATNTPLTATAPATVGTANAVGSATEAARRDHVHFHGYLGGGELHDAAVAGGASGFITGADQQKLLLAHEIALSVMPLWPVVSARHGLNSAQGFANGVATSVNFSSASWDSHGAVTTGPWVFTCPAAGIYRVSAAFLMANYWAGGSITLSLWKNGAWYSALHRLEGNAANTHFPQVLGTDLVGLAVGNTVRIVIQQDSGVAWKYAHPDSSYSYVTIQRNGPLP
jgi:hypothetical protein